MIDGMPARQSVPNRITRVKRVSTLYSERYTAVPTPSGKATVMAPRVRTMVPTMQGKIPPARPMSSGFLRRKSRLTTGNPFARTKMTIKTRMASVTNVAPPRTATAAIWVYLGAILIFSQTSSSSP